MEDIECQEYAAFSLAHLSSNREYQVKLVELGAVRPIVGMLACDAEPKHYAGLALLKLADNFENHLKIAEEGNERTDNDHNTLILSFFPKPTTVPSY